MKIYLVARKGASNSYLLKNKAVCGDPIKLLVPVGDIAIKLSDRDRRSAQIFADRIQKSKRANSCVVVLCRESAFDLADPI